MSPLLYIILMIAALLLIIYVTLTVLDSPRRTRRVWTENNLKFESGQELFQYAPSSLDDADTLDIQPRRSGRILITWKISPRPETDLPQLVIRIYDSSRPDSYHDVKAHNWHGKLSFVSKTGVAYYVAAGLRSKEEFTPLLLSAPVIGGGETLLH